MKNGRGGGMGDRKGEEGGLMGVVALWEGGPDELAEMYGDWELIPERRGERFTSEKRRFLLVVRAKIWSWQQAGSWPPDCGVLL